jgi:hypothetical protein
MAQTWDISQEYETPFSLCEGEWWFFDDEKPLPPELVEFMQFKVPDAKESTVFTLRIPYRSKGYYDAGQCSGPPERCYPPEGEDERFLDGFAEVVGLGKLDKPLSEKVFDLFVDQIEKVEIDTEPEPPDWED